MFSSQKVIIDKVMGLNLPVGNYVVIGGASLAIHGIRETRDLDILVTRELFEKLIVDGWESDIEYYQRWNRKRLKKGDVEIYPDLFLNQSGKFEDVATIISNAEIIDGVPLQDLRDLMRWKIEGEREKDGKDVELIRSYLNSR